MSNLLEIQNWLNITNNDIFIINRTDEFLNEYISPYAERLHWISNFSGSAGRGIIEKKRAFIFVDGRYTNQVNQEVNDKNFEIKHLKDYWSHLKKYKKKNKIITLDPFLHSISEVETLKEIYLDEKTSLNYLDSNPIDLNWKNQPLRSKLKAFNHGIKYSGINSSFKIQEFQKKIKSLNIDFYFLSSLDSIAWLLNIRGKDVINTPLLFSYAIIPCRGKIDFFVDPRKVENLKNFKNLVNVYSLKNIANFIKKINSKKIIALDENRTPFYIKNLCDKQGLRIKYLQDPCLYPKARKNKVELIGAKNANIRDGVSVTKYLYWLKNTIKVNQIDEIKAANYLLKLRKKNNLYYSPSFETISAFGKNAALPHYRVNKDNNLIFKNNSIYLFDSGAQYKDGTTDITRTIIFGKPTEEQKDRFTRVLKGHIAIAQASFTNNTRGFQLDHLARKYLQEINCDYDHGTGHGIGSFLSVHEGPQKISKSKGKTDGLIQEGMIISNEPGYYKEGEYGIRIENLLVCVASKLKYPNILNFKTISFAPIDKDLIDLKLLNKSEIKWLNNYHKKVYKKLAPFLELNEKKWLNSVTSSIG